MRSTSQIRPSYPPKDPAIASLLSLFLGGGGGQIYLGQEKKGIIIILASLLLLCALIGVAIWIIGAYDAFVIGTKLKNGQPVGDMEFFWQAGGRH